MLLAGKTIQKRNERPFFPLFLRLAPNALLFYDLQKSIGRASTNKWSTVCGREDKPYAVPCTCLPWRSALCLPDAVTLTPITTMTPFTRAATGILSLTTTTGTTPATGVLTAFTPLMAARASSTAMTAMTTGRVTGQGLVRAITGQTTASARLT
jgi:hypothetical protein